jgi:hypothetical protein
MKPSAKTPAWKETWFWLVMAPLLLVLVVSIGTVSLAFRVADDRVPDDYFREGRLLNKRFSEEQNALVQGVSGQLEFDFTRGQVQAQLTAEFIPGELQLTFSHPLDGSRDTTVILKRVGESSFRADLPGPLEGRWYLVVSAADSGAHKGWRVTSEVDFQQTHQASFSAHL